MVTSTGNSLGFEQFLTEVDNNYRQEMLLIPLFKPQTILSEKQRAVFAATFYHLRGHFINFLWYIGNFSENLHLKKIILDNIAEELGLDSRFSHEKLYDRFAKECGVDIKDEIVNETNYLPFARAFNKTHLSELAALDEEGQISILAAYERLDNIDYFYLTELAKTFQISSAASAFFRVHLNVAHFQPLKEDLMSIWEHSSSKVQKGFEFIYSNQLQMWQNLSEKIFN